MIGGPFGTPGFDPQGTHRLPRHGSPQHVGHARPPQPGQPFALPQMGRHQPVYRVNLATARSIPPQSSKIPTTKRQDDAGQRGRMSVSIVANPMPVVDDWALLPMTASP